MAKVHHWQCPNDRDRAFKSKDAFGSGSTLSDIAVHQRPSNQPLGVCHGTQRDGGEKTLDYVASFESAPTRSEHLDVRETGDVSLL